MKSIITIGQIAEPHTGTRNTFEVWTHIELNRKLMPFALCGGGSGGEGRGLVLSPDEMQEAEEEFTVGLSDYNNVNALYENLIDGGNTEATLTDVETAMPGDMWELREALLGKSPHLSMEVLKATADKTEVLPESVIFEIMAANPDELKKEELYDILEEKEEPLPST